jgi:hypothetical protein
VSGLTTPIGAVDGHALLEVVWVSFVAGIGVTAAWAAAILGAARSADLSRNGRTGEAAVFGLLAVLGLAIVAAAVVFGIVVMTHK